MQGMLTRVGGDGSWEMGDITWRERREEDVIIIIIIIIIMPVDGMAWHGMLGMLGWVCGVCMRCAALH